MDYIEYLNLPTKAVILLCVAFLVMQLVGEALELTGKVVPEILKVRKYFARKKQERETLAEMRTALDKVHASLKEFNAHYSADNIKMRDDWIRNVNTKLEKNDSLIEELDRKIDKNNADTLELLIESKRETIINFASYVIDEKNPVTREQFNRIFKRYKEYEGIIKENNFTNGEVDIAIRIIRESYETHMRNHTFVEDIRGYEPAAHGDVRS